MARIDLEKVEREAPELVELYKRTTISLDKIQMRNHVARVVCVLDISQSMSDTYRSGKVDELVKKVIALGLQFDDDGEVDILAFGVNCYDHGSYGMHNYKSCVSDILASRELEPGTRYLEALNMLSKKYADSDLPVYVMIVTDGDTQDRSDVERKMISMSKEPIWLQWLGLGEDILPDINVAQDPLIIPGASALQAPAQKRGFFARIFSGSDKVPVTAAKKAVAHKPRTTQGFTFLQSIDDMPGRVVDNANFFAVKDPSRVEDEDLYAYLMNEYPIWLADTKKHGIL